LLRDLYKKLNQGEHLQETLAKFLKSIRALRFESQEPRESLSEIKHGG
jgi:hypothetical protein